MGTDDAYTEVIGISTIEEPSISPIEGVMAWESFSLLVHLPDFLSDLLKFLFLSLLSLQLVPLFFEPIDFLGQTVVVQVCPAFASFIELLFHGPYEVIQLVEKDIC